MFLGGSDICFLSLLRLKVPDAPVTPPWLLLDSSCSSHSLISRRMRSSSCAASIYFLRFSSALRRASISSCACCIDLRVFFVKRSA